MGTDPTREGKLGIQAAYLHVLFAENSGQSRPNDSPPFPALVTHQPPSSLPHKGWAPRTGWLRGGGSSCRVQWFPGPGSPLPGAKGVFSSGSHCPALSTPIFLGEDSRKLWVGLAGFSSVSSEVGSISPPCLGHGMAEPHPCTRNAASGCLSPSTCRTKCGNLLLRAS